MLAKSIKKYILIFSGSVSLALGIIGIIVPVLPTTPFLILSSVCYIQSSDRLYKWLINHKVFGEHITNYTTKKAIKKNTKIAALLYLWISLTASILIVSNLYLKVLLVAIGIGVSAHLYALKTLND